MSSVLQAAVAVGIVFISIGILCVIIMIADSLHDRLTNYRRADVKLSPQAPPPPHVSPFASPRTRTETPPQVAEGEVKT